MKRRRKRFLRIIFVLVAIAALWAAEHWNLLPQKSYAASDFNLKTVHSSVDFNRNGIDDYTDFLIGARADAQNHPHYKDSYYAGGYPPDNIGVCTDVIWRAFRQAGYCLKDMVDADIRRRPEAYPHITKRDSNIDFRRVVNLRIFLEEYALDLTTDPEAIGEWQPGDIVIFGNDRHIGIVSDKRNSKGQPYIIHNGGQPKREEDYLKRNTMSITGHYRFDAAKIDKTALIAWPS